MAKSVVSDAEVSGAVHALHTSTMMLEKVHPSSFTAMEVLDRVLDKGIVIDAVSRVSIAGTELVTLRSHVVVASIATYLRYFGEDDGVANPRAWDQKPRQRASPAPLSSSFPRSCPIEFPLRP